MKKVVILCGPTGVGKSALAVKLSEHLKCEIVNADSQQVWRGLDIGTGKPSPEIRRKISHHLFDVATPAETFDAARYLALADSAIAEIIARGKKVLVVGGTGMYLRMLMFGVCDAPGRDESLRAELEKRREREGLASLYKELQRVDPVSSGEIHENDRVRIIRALEVWQLTGVPLSEFHAQHRFQEPRYDVLQIGLHLEREVLRTAIAARVAAMMQAGWLEEVRALLQKYPRECQALQAIGYKDLVEYVEQGGDLPKTVEQITIRTQQFAKRQMTWFRADSQIHWFASDEEESVAKRIEKFYEV